MLRNTIGGLTAKMLMAPEDNDPSSGGGTPPNTDPNAPPAAPPADPKSQGPPAPKDPAPPAFDGGKPITLSSRDFKRFKEEAVAKAAKKVQAEAMAAREKEAKAAGYPSYAAMVEAAKQYKKQPRQPKPTANQPGGNAPPADDPRAARQLQQLQQQIEAEKAARLRAQKQARRAEAELATQNARHALEQELIRHGVTDVDYAVRLVERKMGALAAGKRDDEVLAAMQAFDLGKYVAEEMRASHPYLFGVETRPANSGPGPSGAPPPPKPAVINNNNAPGPIDARKLSPKEYQEYLRKKGLGRSSSFI